MKFLPSGWTTPKTSEFCLRVADGTHDTPKPEQEGRLLITSKNLKGGRINFDGAYMISESDYLQINKRSKVDKWDVLFSMIGTVGEIALVRSEPDYAIKNIGLFKSNSKEDGVWLYYYLSSSIGQAALDTFLSGTSQQFVALGDLRKIPVIVPLEDSKKKIAAILSAYDELIENNQRRIALLEKMAEETYREWFVRLRFPGHEKVKKDKGVPNGWKVKQFHEIVEYYIGGGWGEDDHSTSFSEAAYVIRGTDIPDIQAGEFEGCPYRFHKPSNLKSRALQQGDFVFEVSGGSTNQLLGRNVFITEHLLKYFNAPVIAASFCKQIRFRRELVSPYFMKYFMKLYYDCDLVGIYQIQSTGISNYQFESFLKYQTIVLPPDELQKKFEDVVKPIVEMRDGISLANIELRKTRDLLLPRLISGKLSVENLDIQFPPSMEEAAHG